MLNAYSSVRLYLRRRGTGYDGICTTFDIVVSGETIEETASALLAMTATFIRDAEAEIEPHRSRLLRRRAPWHVRLRWHLRAHIMICMWRSSVMAS